MLPGHQLKEIRDALCEAFDPNTLKQMLRFQLNRNLEAVVTPGPLEQMVFDLLERSEKELWLTELIRGAHHANPDNLRLRAVYEKHGAASPSQVTGGRVEEVSRSGGARPPSPPSQPDGGTPGRLHSVTVTFMVVRVDNLTLAEVPTAADHLLQQLEKQLPPGYIIRYEARPANSVLLTLVMTKAQAEALLQLIKEEKLKDLGIGAAWRLEDDPGHDLPRHQVPVSGLWEARPSARPDADWAAIARTPGAIRVAPGTILRFRPDADVTDDALRQLRQLAGIVPLRELDLSQCREVTEAGVAELDDAFQAATGTAIDVTPIGRLRMDEPSPTVRQESDVVAALSLYLLARATAASRQIPGLDAEDLVQNTWTRVLKGGLDLKTYSITQARAFCDTALGWEITDQLRRKGEPIPLGQLDDIDPGPSPDRVAEQAEFARTMLARLDPRQREYLRLHLEGKTFQTIAAAHGVAVTTAWTVVQDALEQIRLWAEEESADPPS